MKQFAVPQCEPGPGFVSGTQHGNQCSVISALASDLACDDVNSLSVQCFKAEPSGLLHTHLHEAVLCECVLNNDAATATGWLSDLLRSGSVHSSTDTSLLFLVSRGHLVAPLRPGSDGSTRPSSGK